MAAKPRQTMQEPQAAEQLAPELSAAAPAARTRTSAIDRAVQILDALQDTNRPTTAYEIARLVGAPLYTVYSIINDRVE